MDATTLTVLKSHIPVRAFAGPVGVLSFSGRPAIGLRRSRTVFDIVEIFKKTPCAADLKPAGRDVAKDMLELDSMSVQQAIELKITGVRPAARQTKMRHSATSHTSKAIWEFARQDGAAGFGIALRSGRAHEKQCYASF